MNEDTNAALPTTPVTNDDLLKVLEVPAFFANRFVVNGGSNFIRVTFFEQATSKPEDSIPRCAVVLDTSGIVALHKLLDDLIAGKLQK